MNAYWHSHWVQETGMFSSDKRNDVWACGSTAECTELYGTAYTSTGGAIDPPQPVGNIAATIQAPNLSITSGGEIQNVGNVIGTSVSLTGQKLINGITTANTYTPRVNAPSQVISLSPVDLPGLNLSTPRSISSGPLPTPVAGKASYVDGSLGGEVIGALGPQALLSSLPPSLQPSSTLFYYNPQEEDLLLQQAALQQTGQASFINGLSYDSTTGLSVTEQEKGYLYQNAITYAEQNNIQLGNPLTQAQINALDAPMLWYVEQTVPDPTCTATGTATCPTITALMPQVYLPQDTSAMSAGGNITGQNVALNFNQGGNGSVLNTGTITASDTLTVNTGSLTNEANQVNVGDVWNSVKGGYVDTTGTTVQPGGFMSAANMDLNVQTLDQIGGALQKLNPDGTVDEAGTQQLLASLQQQLGANFTQTSESDDLHTNFVKEGGSFGAMQLIALVAAVVVTILTYGAASAAIGAATGATEAASTAAAGAAAAGSTAAGTAAAAAEAGGAFMAAVSGASAGLGNVILSAGIASMASSAASQLITSGSLDWGAIGEAGLVGAVTAGLTNGITYSSANSIGFNTGASVFGVTDPSIASLAGVQTVGNSLVPLAGAAATSSIPTEILAIGADATISAGVESVVEGGSFLTDLRNGVVSDAAAAGAYAIGNLNDKNFFGTGVQGELGYAAAHAVLGCAAGAAEGTGCAGGAIGGATSAFISPVLVDEMGGAANLTDEQRALITAIAMVSGGSIAGAVGQDAIGAATSAENEALNNAEHGKQHPLNLTGKPAQEGVTVEDDTLKIVPGTSAPLSDEDDEEGSNITIGRGLPVGPGLSFTNSGSTVPSSILGANGNLPLGIGGIGTPIPMPATVDSNATAEQFATAAFNGQTPVKVTANTAGNGSWVAIMPDGTAITYRPAGQASLRTDPGTATVEVNSPSVLSINAGKIAKFKFPSK